MSERADEATNPASEDSAPDADPHDAGEPHGTTPRSIVLYLVAFALLIASVAVIGIGALLGFSTSHFWISTLLSLLAIGAAGAAVLPARARSVD
ncbi:MAG: hypothetical protein WEA10_06045 [Actinomycetota bacterium]